MKPEDINIAIAEYCGWKRLTGVPSDMFWPGPSYITGKDGNIMKPPGATHRHGVPPPNYHGDLNAIRDAEMLLPDYDYDHYLESLDFVTWAPDQTSSQRRKQKHSAGAAQRAEAFLRTVGKWKEEA